MIGEKFVLLSFSYIKLCELGVEDAFYNGTAVVCYKIDLLKYPQQVTYCERAHLVERAQRLAFAAANAFRVPSTNPKKDALSTLE